MTALCLGLVAPGTAAAQTTGTTTSTAAAPATTTTSAPPQPTTTAPSTSTTTSAPAPTTTAAPQPTVTSAPATTPAPPATSAPTTAPPPPPAWTVQVPGPPPPPPPPVGVSPADLALAGQLESQIASQARVLDIRAEAYDRAQQAVALTTDQVAQIQGQMASANNDGISARAEVTSSEQALRAVAVDAYVGVGASSPRLNPSLLLAAYEKGLVHAATETALGKAFANVKQLQESERQVKQVQQELDRVNQQAVSANLAARVAAAQSQADAQAAAQQQTQLLATLSKVSANLGPLVAAAQSARAQAAFNTFSTQTSPLDFTLLSPLAGAPAQAAAAIQAATSQLGKPYVWGGNGPDVYDCSGLMKWAWAQVGVTIPRVAADQQAWATPVPISQLAPGDLVFFGNPAHHVGMYVGNGMMVDAPHSGAFVEAVPIWWDELAGFGRVHKP